MNNYIMKCSFQQVNSKKILVDPTYQRLLDTKRVKEIVSKFNPYLVNPVKVSLRDGNYYVFDGQHTLAVLLAKNNNQPLMVPCLVYDDLSYEEEAMLFSQQTGLARDVNIKFKAKAQFIGKDEEMVDLYNLVTSSGFKFDFTNIQAEKKIIATATLCRIYQHSTREEFTDILEIIRDAWEFKPNSLKKEILGGVHYFYTYPDYKGVINKKKAISQFSKADPFIIIRDSKKYGTCGDRRYATSLAMIYNKGLRTDRLPYIIY